MCGRACVLTQCIFQGLKDVNETQSLLQWVPLKEDNGQVVICRAEHSKFNRSTIESKMPLNIYCELVTAFYSFDAVFDTELDFYSFTFMFCIYNIFIL